MSLPVPSYVKDISRKKYAEQEKAGENFEYGAIGDFDYRIDADLWVNLTLSTNPITKKEELKPIYERKPLLTVRTIVDIVRKCVRKRAEMCPLNGSKAINIIGFLLGSSGLLQSEKNQSSTVDNDGIVNPIAVTATNADTSESTLSWSDNKSQNEDRTASLRVLDLGTGDGKCLHMLHHEKGIPWTNLLGITAEDMRGKRVLKDEDTFDPHCPDSSYLVANIEDLSWNQIPDLQDGENDGSTLQAEKRRHFDLIVSWVTFCWLTDPLGTMCHIHNDFLAEGGVMVIGGIQLLMDEGKDKEGHQQDTLNEGNTHDDQQFWLFAWALYLREVHKLNIRFVVDACSGAYAWCFVQKTLHQEDAHDVSSQSKVLSLQPCLSYGKIDGHSNKVSYKINTVLLRPYHERVKSECDNESANLPSTRRRTLAVDKVVSDQPEWSNSQKIQKMLRQYTPLEKSPSQ